MKTIEKVYDELKYVFDPEFGVNIVDLGYVYHIEKKDHNGIKVIMTFASNDCQVQERICKGVKYAVSTIDGISEVEVEKTWVPKWGTHMMNEEIKKELVGIS